MMYLSLLVASASAGEVATGIHATGLVLGPNHELTHPDNADEFEGQGVAFGLGGRASVAFARWFQMEGELEAGAWPLRSGSAFVAGWRVGPRFVAHDVGIDGLHPHVTVGAGSLVLVGNALTSGDDVDFAAHVGPGVEFDLDRRLAMRADVRGLVTAKRGIALLPSVQGLVTVGILYRNVREVVEPTVVPEAPPPVATLRLRVHDGHGHAIHDAEVHLGDDALGVTDAEGELVVTGLTPQESTLTVFASTTMEHDAPVRIVEGDNAYEVDLDWMPGALHVNARGPDGAPTDAHVTARRVGYDPQEWSLGADGQGYRSLAPGTWTIAVAAEGAALHVEDVEVSAARDSLVDLRLDLNAPKLDVTAEQIVLRESVRFALASSEVLAESTALLQEVSDVLIAYPHLDQIRIEGHTDAMGDDERNLALSRARAEEVLRILVTLGVEPSRLVANGFGESRPIDDNSTPEGRARNRRVEFHIR